MPVAFHNFPESAVPGMKKAAARALKHRPGVKAGAINFIMVSDEEIRKLNRKFRKVNRITDVISFRYSETPLEGDIYMSDHRTKKQGEKVGHTWEQELAYLTIHGILHLFGYADYKPAERAEMFGHQDALFGQLYPALKGKTSAR